MRYISFVCCLLLLSVSLLSGFGGLTTAQALESALTLGDEYKSSPFYERLLAVELTGDHRYDTVAIAISQLGYHEGDCEADMDGLNSDGGRNFAEYTRVWGKVDNQEGNGVSYGYAWCAAYVSWCLRQAGVPTGVALTEISCNRMTNSYKSKGQFYSADSGYKPVLGDIIMFADEDSPSHVGLVLGVMDGRVYTIEGNGGEKVATHSYSLTSTYVFGYCVPEYTVKRGMDYASLMERALEPVGNYIVTANNIGVMPEASSSGDSIGSLKKGDEIEVIDYDGSWCKIKFGELEGWIVKGGIVDAKLLVYTVKYDFKGGKGSQSSQRKTKGTTITLSDQRPTKNGYVFAGWSLKKSAKNVDYARGAEYSADADVVLYAVWTPRAQTVTYYNYDGSVFEVIECGYNDWLTEPETIPTKPDDDEYSYVFAGWDKELDDIVYRNLEYTATFTAVPKIEESSAETTDEATTEATDEATTEATDEESREDADGKESSLLAIYIIGGVGFCMIAVAVVLIIVKNKKKKEK